MKPSPQIDDPSAETLIADQRAGLTPADIVERRFRTLLDNPSSKVGMPQINLPRVDGLTRRTIAYTSRGDPRGEATRRNASSDHGESYMYAISVEQELATEILTRLRPWPFHFWQTEHRGLLLIHARTQKPGKGLATSKQNSTSNALVGMVELRDCLPTARPDADLDEIEYHWLLANPYTFARPLPYHGKLGLFLVSEEVVSTALRQAAKSRKP